MDICVEYFLVVVYESRRNGRISAPFNETFIALIHKVENVKKWEDFWPISLCNCIYKLIHKFIANMMKKVLSNAILEEQFSFIQGREIHEVVSISQEVLHSAKTKKILVALIKVDLKKAYDRVNFLYLIFTIL